MPRLTSERCNGIKYGYWSPFTKEVVTQRLGLIEAKAPELIEAICDQCHHPYAMQQAELEETCRSCPLTRLEKLINDGEYK